MFTKIFVPRVEYCESATDIAKTRHELESVRCSIQNRSSGKLPSWQRPYGIQSFLLSWSLVLLELKFSTGTNDFLEENIVLLNLEAIGISNAEHRRQLARHRVPCTSRFHLFRHRDDLRRSRFFSKFAKARSGLVMRQDTVDLTRPSSASWRIKFSFNVSSQLGPTIEHFAG